MEMTLKEEIILITAKELLDEIDKLQLQFIKNKLGVSKEFFAKYEELSELFNPKLRIIGTIEKPIGIIEQ
jgi:hypothetical protein